MRKTTTTATASVMSTHRPAQARRRSRIWCTSSTYMPEPITQPQGAKPIQKLVSILLCFLQ
jgi:hypothetical protein